MTFPPPNFDPSIDPTADQVRALRDAGPDGPVVMLNLLKFREHANYPAGDRKSTRLNSSHIQKSRMPSSA